MPVQGVNLTDGDCAAIGVLFANAFARDAGVAVASPLDTQPLRTEGELPAAIATTLGASRYVELHALRLAKRVRIEGTLYGQDGARLFRAEVSAVDLEGADQAIAALADALARQRPVPPARDGTDLAATQVDAAAAQRPPETSDPNAPRGAYGPKVALVVPQAQGKSFTPGLSIQFDGRYGPPAYFLEFGAGLLVPTDDSSTSTTIRVTSGFLEIGASTYLWAGNSALYVGAGVLPALWVSAVGLDQHIAATCGVYGQLGITFTRNRRVRVYGEFRLSQLLLGVAHPLSDGSAYATGLSDPYRPMILALQAGVGF